jgi:hypothetical protein
MMIVAPFDVPSTKLNTEKRINQENQATGLSFTGNSEPLSLCEGKKQACLRWIANALKIF